MSTDTLTHDDRHEAQERLVVSLLEIRDLRRLDSEAKAGIKLRKERLDELEDDVAFLRDSLEPEGGFHLRPALTGAEMEVVSGATGEVLYRREMTAAEREGWLPMNAAERAVREFADSMGEGESVTISGAGRTAAIEGRGRAGA